MYRRCVASSFLSSKHTFWFRECTILSCRACVKFGYGRGPFVSTAPVEVSNQLEPESVLRRQVSLASFSCTQRWDTVSECRESALRHQFSYQRDLVGWLVSVGNRGARLLFGFAFVSYRRRSWRCTAAVMYSAVRLVAGRARIAALADCQRLLLLVSHDIVLFCGGCCFTTDRNLGQKILRVLRSVFRGIARY